MSAGTQDRLQTVNGACFAPARGCLMFPALYHACPSRPVRRAVQIRPPAATARRTQLPGGALSQERGASGDAMYVDA